MVYNFCIYTKWVTHSFFNGGLQIFEYSNTFNVSFPNLELSAYKILLQQVIKRSHAHDENALLEEKTWVKDRLTEARYKEFYFQLRCVERSLLGCLRDAYLLRKRWSGGVAP